MNVFVAAMFLGHLVLPLCGVLLMLFVVCLIWSCRDIASILVDFYPSFLNIGMSRHCKCALKYNHPNKQHMNGKFD